MAWLECENCSADVDDEIDADCWVDEIPDMRGRLIVLCRPCREQTWDDKAQVHIVGVAKAAQP